MLEITEAKLGDVVCLELIGRLDTNTSSQLEEVIGALIDKGEKRFVVDFSRLEYISSSGLRALLLAAKRLKTLQGGLVLCALNEHIQKIFDISALSSIFPIVHSQEEAIKSYGS